MIVFFFSFFKSFSSLLCLFLLGWLGEFVWAFWGRVLSVRVFACLSMYVWLSDRPTRNYLSELWFDFFGPFFCFRIFRVLEQLDRLAGR